MLSLIRCQKVRNFLTTVGLETGPACNYCNRDKCLFDVKEVSESITVGNGKTMEATNIGNLRCDVEQVTGKTFKLSSKMSNMYLSFG
jgi:hypothetical protein